MVISGYSLRESSCPSYGLGPMMFRQGRRRRAKHFASHARTTGVSALLAEAPNSLKVGPPDGDLVAMTLRGDSEAFATLVERYDRAVYHLAYRTLHDVEEARDATQEAFFKAFRSLRTFRLGSKFSTWIFAITYHACCDRLNRRKHYASDELPDRPDAGPGPEHR